MRLKLKAEPPPFSSEEKSQRGFHVPDFISASHLVQG